MPPSLDELRRYFAPEEADKRAVAVPPFPAKYQNKQRDGKTIDTSLVHPPGSEEFAKQTPTHRCIKCGAFWIEWPPSKTQPEGSWSLASKECNTCCDNEVMGEQIESIAPYNVWDELGPPGTCRWCHHLTGSHHTSGPLAPSWQLTCNYNKGDGIPCGCTPSLRKCICGHALGSHEGSPLVGEWGKCQQCTCPNYTDLSLARPKSIAPGDLLGPYAKKDVKFTSEYLKSFMEDEQRRLLYGEMPPIKSRSEARSSSKQLCQRCGHDERDHAKVYAGDGGPCATCNNRESANASLPPHTRKAAQEICPWFINKLPVGILGTGTGKGYGVVGTGGPVIIDDISYMTEPPRHPACRSEAPTEAEAFIICKCRHYLGQHMETSGLTHHGCQIIGCSCLLTPQEVLDNHNLARAASVFRATITVKCPTCDGSGVRLTAPPAAVHMVCSTCDGAGQVKTTST
jgi:hypothetical protein